MSKSENRQRTERVIFRLTSKERQNYEARCQSSGVSKSDYFRQCCLESKPLRKRKSPSVEVQTLLKLMGQMGKIGSNLNQIAKAYNLGYLQANDELDIALVEHRELLSKVRKILSYDY